MGMMPYYYNNNLMAGHMHSPYMQPMMPSQFMQQPFQAGQQLMQSPPMQQQQNMSQMMGNMFPSQFMQNQGQAQMGAQQMHPSLPMVSQLQMPFLQGHQTQNMMMPQYMQQGQMPMMQLMQPQAMNPTNLQTRSGKVAGNSGGSDEEDFQDDQ